MLDLTGNINYMDNLNYLVPNEAVGNAFHDAPASNNIY